MALRNNSRFFIKKPKRFEIWSEGYQCTGEHAGAMLHGTMTAMTFAEACIALAQVDKAFRDNFNADNLSFWGCRLFDNEKDARKSFG